MRIIKLLLVFLLCIQFETEAQFIKLSGIHDSVDTSFVDFLNKSGFGKVDYYFDDLNQKDGKWYLYPSLKLSDNLNAVNVLTIPGRKSEYNFLLIVDTKSKSILDTLGPFYDTFVEAIAFKLSNSQIVQLKVRLNNPPELNEPKFTIIEYSRKNQTLKKIKSYDKN